MTEHTSGSFEWVMRFLVRDLGYGVDMNVTTPVPGWFHRELAKQWMLATPDDDASQEDWEVLLVDEGLVVQPND